MNRVRIGRKKRYQQYKWTTCLLVGNLLLVPTSACFENDVSTEQSPRGIVVDTHTVSSIPPVQQRPFYMGFTDLPYDFTQQAVADTYNFIENNADLILFHQDNGIPWPEALAGMDAYHPNVIAAIDQQVAGVRNGQKIFVSVTPQSTMRGGELAPYRGVEDNMPMPIGWENRTLDDPEVILSFTNWCRYLIERFNPDYFAYSIECNGGFTGPNDPALAQYLALEQEVYNTLKAEFKHLPIFVTVQTSSTEALRADFLQLTQLLLQYSDIVAISSYPYMVLRYGGWDPYTDPAEIPVDLLTSITDLAPNKPMAISETGYIAEDLLIPEFLINISGNEIWQAQYVQRLMEELSTLNAEFVVWFVSRDYDLGLQTLKQYGIPIDPSWLLWRDNGVVDGVGQSRPAHAVWRQWLAARKVEPSRPDLQPNN